MKYINGIEKLSDFAEVVRKDVKEKSIEDMREMVKPRKVISISIIVLIISSLTYGVYYYSNRGGEEIFISTTTSIQNTGLLDYLIEIFQEEYQLTVRYTAVGSGAAIQLAKDGEVDATITHAPSLENELIKEGYSSQKHILWYNYFVVVGPQDGPVEVHQNDNITQIFGSIYERGENDQLRFYSRGDHSGTHIKELQIWNQTSLKPNPAQQDWYLETGAGMSSTLIATDNEDNGYSLSDIGTFATLKEGQPPLQKSIVYQDDEVLYNPYSYMIIDSKKTGTDLNSAGARLFLEFLQDSETDELVRNYKIGDVVLFHPIADRN